MFSLQRLLGRDDEFLGLLEESAREGVQSVEALKVALSAVGSRPSMDTFNESRRRNKERMARLAELHYSVLVTSLEREDIDAIAEALYKIPKTVEAFAERYLLSYDQVREFDFTWQIVHMDEATKSVAELMAAFRALASMSEIKRLDSRIQRIENDADDTMLAFIGKLMDPEFPALRGIILKDLVELNERVVDRCRDASSVIARITMKIL